MNVVMLVGEVTDRPFRPGNGTRTVVKLKTKGSGGQADRFEFDAFGQVGDFGARLHVGDIVAVSGRLEDRTFTENGEQVSELRIVAQFIEVVTRAGDRVTPRPSSEAAASSDA